MVQIDPGTGQVDSLIDFPLNCGLFLQSAAISAATGVLYAWIMCDPDNTRVVGAFDLRSKKMVPGPPPLNVSHSDPWNPMVFIDGPPSGGGGGGSGGGVTGLIAVDTINALSKLLLKNNETTRLSSTLGGIPANAISLAGSTM